MKLFFCLLAFIVVSNAALLDLEALVSIGNPCHCFRKGGFFNNNQCTRATTISNWWTGVTPVCAIDAIAADVDLQVLDLAYARTLVAVDLEATVRAAVDLRVAAVKTAAIARCNKLIPQTGLGLLNVLSELKINTEFTALVNEITLSPATCEAKKTSSDNLLLGLVANLNLDLSVGGVNGLLVSARLSVLASVGVNLLGSLRDVVAFNHNLLRNRYALLNSIYVNALADVNTTVNAAVRAYARNVLAGCLKGRVGLLGALLNLVANLLNSLLVDEVNTEAILRVALARYHVLQHQIVNLPRHVDAVVGAHAAVVAELDVLKSTTTGLVLGLWADVKLSLLNLNVRAKAALLIADQVEHTTACKVEHVATNAADVALVVKTEFVKLATYTQADIDARVKLYVAAAVKAIAHSANVAEAAVVVEAGAVAAVAASVAAASASAHAVVKLDLAVTVLANARI
eukprot:TRINITY_DN396_c0_g1_i1.p1 TRINITY_DN396_c0_g1~~TRINITY_DN396_c0_g1_i1.p1  ORF type:complete len:458 (+),score=117.85 TRINITY_DN396_c0_g1_i1:58-1431(+)